MTKQFNDLGLGAKVKRLLNHDGTFNVKRTGLGISSVNVYQWLVKMSWANFLILVTFILCLINSLFAVTYYIIGVEHFAGMMGGTELEQFLQCFFFSFQTFTTVGYGHIAPRGELLSLIAALEAMTGLMVFAIITGLVYGRFARPEAKILYSASMLMAPYGDGDSLQFRVVNKRKSNIMDLSAKVMVSFQEKGKNRTYQPLELERSSVALFPLNWTIVHPLTDKSPLFGKTLEDLKTLDTEIIVILKGFDDTFSQEVNSLHSYLHSEIVWNARFEPMYETESDNSVSLDFKKLNTYHLVK